VRDLNLKEPVAAVSPDTGRTKLAGKFAEMIDGDLVVLNKERPEHQVARVTTVIGDVEAKVAVMTDDIVDTAGTLVGAVKALREEGASRVLGCFTHPVLSGPALERIQSSDLEHVVVTDSIALSDVIARNPKITVLSVASLLGEAIARIHSNSSVSSLFV
jgi:ribose-phosphate pyrophosphokinase